MTNHIHNCHGSLTKYDASKRLKELHKLKEERQRVLKRSHSFSLNDEQPSKKQHSLQDCIQKNEK